MSNDSSSGGNVDRTRLATLLEQFKRAPGATAANRSARDQLLDELQDAVGLSGKMATESEIVRRADKLIQGR
jgi:hypothetical protein